MLFKNDNRIGNRIRIVSLLVAFMMFFVFAEQCFSETAYSSTSTAKKEWE